MNNERVRVRKLIRIPYAHLLNVAETLLVSVLTHKLMDHLTTLLQLASVQKFQMVHSRALDGKIW